MIARRLPKPIGIFVFCIRTGARLRPGVLIFFRGARNERLMMNNLCAPPRNLYSRGHFGRVDVDAGGWGEKGASNFYRKLWALGAPAEMCSAINLPLLIFHCLYRGSRYLGCFRIPADTRQVFECVIYLC